MASRAERAAKLGKGIGHPLRVQILELATRHGEVTPNRLSKELEEPLGNVSYHTMTLRDLGALKLTKTEPRRGAVEHYYALTATGRALVDVIETI